jgi:DNA polymerase III epsilon subunit-like protein
MTGRHFSSVKSTVRYASYHNQRKRMRTAIFDLETSSLNANAGIVLCGCFLEYGKPKVTTFRADQYKNWKTNKSDNSLLVKDILAYLEDFDILVAHNGQYFDKAWLNAACIKYGLPPTLRFKKFIDPVQISRRQFKLGRNSLASLIDYLEIPEKKTGIEFRHWVQASHDSNVESMEVIVTHCIQDVKSLAIIYHKLRPLIDKVDKTGSAY